MDKSNKDWSKFLEQGILFFEPKYIIQAPDFNPVVVNTILGCFAASLYIYNGENSLSLIGTAGEITANEFFKLEENEVFVVDAFNQKDRVIAYREDKQTLYVTQPIGETVLCLHFSLAEKWTKDTVKAYGEELEYAIINEHEHFFDLLILLIGGKT